MTPLRKDNDNTILWIGTSLDLLKQLDERLTKFKIQTLIRPNGLHEVLDLPPPLIYVIEQDLKTFSAFDLIHAARRQGRKICIILLVNKQDFKLSDPYPEIGAILAPDHQTLTHLTQALESLAAKQRLEAELAQAQLLASLTLHAVKEGILIIDAHGKIHDVNGLAIKALGLPKEQLLDKNLFEVANFYFSDKTQSFKEWFESRMKLSQLDPVQERIKLKNHAGEMTEMDLSLSIPPTQPHNSFLVLLTLRDVSNSQKLSQQLLYQASHDSLTGMYNREVFFEKLSYAISFCERYDGEFAVLFIDLDKFKPINDLHGHAYGDELLKQVSQRLQTVIRGTDVSARIGGDEFGVILPNITNPENVVKIAQKVINVLKEPFLIIGECLQIGVSIGIALYPRDALIKDTLIHHADEAMYIAKKNGGNQFSFYQPALNNKVSFQKDLFKDFDAALKNNEFKLLFQGQFDVVQHTMVGLEAFLRWQHPELGLVMPNQFINVAQDGNTIKLLTAQALKLSALQIETWKKAEVPIFPIGLNVAGSQIDHKDVLERLQRHTAIAPYIEFEMSADIFSQDTENIRKVLLGIRELGFKLALDNFGLGNMSLSTLTALPLNTIKIDKSIAQTILTQPMQEHIVKSVIAIAKEMNARVIATGVDNEEVSNLFKNLGCHLQQGYFLQLPQTEEAMTEILKQQKQPN